VDDLIDRLSRWAGWDPVGPRPQAAARWMPTAEEDETAEGYRVRLELPGIPRDRVAVEVEGRQLCVRGDLDETAAPHDSYLAHRAGSFRYRTSLPADADLDAVRADLSDGVLTVTVPRSGPAGRRSVPIGGAAGGESGSHQVITGHAEQTGSGSSGSGSSASGASGAGADPSPTDESFGGSTPGA
jgi:HSP20 family protein